MSPGKPLRADAARNHAALLAAADELLAVQGLELSLDEVARRAGVGNATLYRHFGTQQALVEAVLDAKIEAYVQSSEDAAERAVVEPWEAFEGFVTHHVEQHATNRAFAGVLGAPAGELKHFRAKLQQALHATQLLCRRGVDAGVLRPDFHHSDLLLLTRAITGLPQDDRRLTLQAALRLRGLFLDAVRVSPAHEPLPPPPERWTTLAERTFGHDLDGRRQPDDH